MELRKILITILLLSCAACHETADSSSVSSPPPEAEPSNANPQHPSQLDHLVADYMNLEPNPAGLAIGIIRDGIPQTFTYGSTTLDGETKPLTSSMFRVESITKTFTATLLARYVQKGLVAFDDPLQNYMPEWVIVPTYNGQAITLLELATHTSGLPTDPAAISLDDPYSDEQLLTALSEVELTRNPGEQYQYSNFGYSLLGIALEKAAGIDYQTAIQQELTNPLGLNDSVIDVLGENLPRLVTGYLADGDAVPTHCFAAPAHRAAGCMISTLDDQMKWLAFNLGMTDSSLNSLLPVTQLPRHDEMSPQVKVGLGWNLRKLQNGNTMIFKAGGTEASGYHSYMVFIPETMTGVVILSNYTNNPEKLAEKILELISHD